MATTTREGKKELSGDEIVALCRKHTLFEWSVQTKVDPKVVKAIQDQAATLAYANPFMATEARALLGARLAGITPGDMDTFFFTNGGADAVENAVRIARVVTGRHKLYVYLAS